MISLLSLPPSIIVTRIITFLPFQVLKYLFPYCITEITTSFKQNGNIYIELSDSVAIVVSPNDKSTHHLNKLQIKS